MENNDLVTVNSISGGKTSSYMALHYPADINIFALVRTVDKNCKIKDKGLRDAVQAKFPKLNEEVMSRELDGTLKAVLDLEQILGKEIVWVKAQDTFDSLIERKRFLPSPKRRFCTVELKIKPITYWLYHNTEFPVIMNIGFRADEFRRVNNWKCSNDKLNGLEFRITNFPLYHDKIFNEDIIKFWECNKNVIFPKFSDCDFCFHRSKARKEQLLRMYPERYEWWLEQENKTGHYFTKAPLKPISNNCGCGI